MSRVVVFSPIVTNFWRSYQKLVDSHRSSLGGDFIDLFYRGEEKPIGSHSLYFRPWKTDPWGEPITPYLGYQTKMGRIVLYVHGDKQTTDLDKFIAANPGILKDEKHWLETGENKTQKLILNVLPSIDIRIQTFEECEKIAELSYEKVVKLYKIAKQALSGYK